MMQFNVQEGAPLVSKGMKISLSWEDFTQFNYTGEPGLRKRIWSSDYLLLDDRVEGNNTHLDSQVNMGGADTAAAASSSQKTKKKEKKKATREDFVAKFKTEMCKFWEAKGSCPYGKRCAFAHGDTEKRYKGPQKDRKAPIKCFNFHQHGYCSYGRRCQYIHFTTPVVFNKTPLCYQEKLNDPNYFEEHGSDCICTSRRRLDAFKRITSFASPMETSE